MGLDVYVCKGKPKEWEGDYDYEALKDRDVNLPSTKYPEHYFKIGYFRSSYNSSGINGVLDNLGVDNLYSIFPKEKEAYVFRPNWEESLVKVKSALALLREKEKEGAFNADHVSTLSQAKSDKEAIELFMRARQDHKGADYANFTCRDGAFYLNGTEIFAVIPGVNLLGVRGAYIVYKQPLEFYTQALEIVIETIEWVLSQKDPLDYCLRWSG
jgi:hypothetical protein